MRQYMQWDIYTMLIVAIVPVFLAVAWGLSWNHERVSAAQACEATKTYLADVSEFASLYTEAGTVDDADQWLSRLETIQPQGHAWEIHDSALSTFEYASMSAPELDTNQPGGIYEEIAPFQSSIDDARANIVDNCPDLEPMLPDAFPMFFKEQ